MTVTGHSSPPETHLGDHAPSPAAMVRLVQAVRDLAAARDVDSVVDIVRHAARELVDADGATFVLRDNGQCYYVDEDAIEPLWRGQRFPLEACISGWAMLHNEAVMIPDIYLDSRIPHDAYRPTFVHSLTMTPIRSAEPIGAIGTYWASEHVATPADLEILQALADSTSVAMENVRVLRELESRVADRTGELVASNRDLAAFAQVAAHDLKAPLATIAGYAELIEEVDADRLSEVGADAVGTVRRQAIRMTELIDAVLAYSLAATTPLATGPIDLEQTTRNVVHDLEGLANKHGARIRIGQLPSGWGSTPLIERVLQNLIANAIVYGDPTAPEVRIDGATSGHCVSVSVTDNGDGVDPDEQERIFDMFTRGRSAGRSPGSGIGLAFSRRVLARHGGTLLVAAGEPQGARFTMTLPTFESEHRPQPPVAAAEA